MTEKIPPHNIDAEKAVLGGIILEPSVLQSVLQEGIVSGDFFLPAHQVIWAAMEDLKDTLIDMITVSNCLRGKGELDKAGGMAYISSLSDDCPSAANILYHCRIVKDKALLRQAGKQAQEIVKKVLEPGARIEDIPTTLSIDRPQKIEVRHVSGTIKQLDKNIKAGYPGIDPQYTILRNTIRKISPGHLWIIGGYTSTGKSFVASDLVCNLNENEDPGIAIFSTEMSEEQYLLRMLARDVDCPTWAIAENKLMNHQYPNYVKALSHIHSKRLFIYDNLYKFSEIEQATRVLREKKNISIVIIDYLQNIWAPGRTIYERMSPLAPQLQFLAKNLGITIIALSQVDNASAKEGSKIIGYKGAGEIAAAADLCIELERYKEIAKKDWLKFTVRKNRHGKVGTGNFIFSNHYRRLKELPPDEE